MTTTTSIIAMSLFTIRLTVEVANSLFNGSKHLH